MGQSSFRSGSYERLCFRDTNMRLLINKEVAHPNLLDTSELLRPEQAFKEKEAFRDYTQNDELGDRVKKTYYEMHTCQTLAFVKDQHTKWLQYDHMEANVMEALDMLNDLVDESDPDTELPNIVHAFQTAERIREEHPDKDWFHLIGLIHDLGKIMAFYGEPQWAVVGDTFPVGCRPQPSIVFGEESFQNNPDMMDERYNTQLGIYQEGCGQSGSTLATPGTPVETTPISPGPRTGRSWTGSWSSINTTSTPRVLRYLILRQSNLTTRV